MCKLLATFWDHQDFITRYNVYHSPNFMATQGTTQVWLISLTFFDVVVDNMARMWLETTVKDQVMVK